MQDTVPRNAKAKLANDPNVLLDIRDLKVHFPISGGLLGSRGAVKAVDGVNLMINKGETLGVVGESGCGKSTTGRAILRLIPITGGTVSYKGQNIAKISSGEMRQLRAEMQMVFQDPFASLDPRYTVEQVIAEPLINFNRGNRQQRRERVKELLGLVGISSNVLNRYPHEFSGGQRQRIGIARSLALNPALVIADEPVSALDVSVQAQVLNLMEDLQSQLGLTYMFIAHNLSVVRHISNRVAVMYLGRVVEISESKMLYAMPLHPYTKSLMSAIPLPDPIAESQRQRIVLTGDIPNPASPPPGCHFHLRCPLYQKLGSPAICRTEVPVLESKDGSAHMAACHYAGQF
jgi:oligopeptide transport system ATP-binding protein